MSYFMLSNYIFVNFYFRILCPVIRDVVTVTRAVVTVEYIYIKVSSFKGSNK